MESTSQTGLHKETQGRAVTTEITGGRSDKTSLELARKTNEVHHRWKQPQRGARQAAALKRASIQRISPEIKPAVLPDRCPQVPYMRTYKEPGRYAIQFESREDAAGLPRDLDEWPRLERRLEPANGRINPRKKRTFWDFEHLRNMVEVRRRIHAVGHSSRPNAKSNPSA